MSDPNVPALAWAAGQLLEVILTRDQAAGELDVPLDDEPETAAGQQFVDADSRTKRSGTTEIRLMEQGGDAWYSAFQCHKLRFFS